MIKVNQQEINLGELKFGVPHSFKYVLTNVSDHSVHIDRIVLGCMACTTARASKTIIEPKETAEINAVFTPGSTGIANKTLSVIIDGTEHKLKFKATVHE